MIEESYEYIKDVPRKVTEWITEKVPQVYEYMVNETTKVQKQRTEMVERVIENVKTVMDKVRVQGPEVLSAAGVSVGGGSTPVAMSAAESAAEEVQEPGFADRMQTAIKERAGQVRAELSEVATNAVVSTIAGPAGPMLADIAGVALHESAVLPSVFNDSVELADHKEVTPDELEKGIYPAVSFEEFLEYSNGRTIEQLQTDRLVTGERLPADSHAQGPLYQYRYVIDPSDSNRVIDMRHFLVVGERGEAFGLGVELIQLLGDKGSAFNSQDFYSNHLGESFFRNYDRHQDFSEQLGRFFQGMMNDK